MAKHLSCMGVSSCEPVPLHYALTEDDVVVSIEEVCQVGAQCMMRSISTDLGERFMHAFGNGPLPIGQQRDM